MTIGLPFTPRNTKPYLTLFAATPAFAVDTRSSHVAGAAGKTSLR